MSAVNYSRPNSPFFIVELLFPIHLLIYIVSNNLNKICFMQKLLLLAMLFCFCACSWPELDAAATGTSFPVNTYLKQDNIPSQFFEIDTRHDTTLKTKGGARIFIPKEAIVAKDKRNSVKLELKEAYTMEDILKAGLRTKSGAQVLSSGGMIYLNAADATLRKEINVSIPSGNVKAGMQLYEGVPTADGSIDWQNPKPAVQNSFTDSVALGKSIFNNNCASCHHPDKDATGPSLAFAPQRRDKKWLKKFIQNSAAVIASGDLLANCMYSEWNKTAMTSFPNLTDAELEALYTFLNEESKQLNPADYPDFQKSLDSCKLYYETKRNLEFQLKVLESSSSSKEAVLAQNTAANPGNNAPEATEVAVTVSVPKYNLVVPKSETATNYQFTINTFGWFNVDILIQGLPGFVSSSLKVSISNKLEAMYNVYLILPEDMICTNGGFLKGSKEWYGFATDDGTIALPQNRKAYVLAFCEQEEQISFAIDSFFTGINNAITLNAAPITPSAMTTRLNTLNFKGFKAGIKENKLAKEIKKLKVDLGNVSQLKPKQASCNCYDFEKPLMLESDSSTWR